ncbi:Na(+)/H(+) antiporter subunit C [bacterium]|nr:Na(+)/H(+) antiporter subunit C [bacterium]
MGLMTALLVAILTGGGAWLMMRKNLFELLLGLGLFSHGINLFLMSMGGWSATEEVPLPSDHLTPDRYADPVPMALILTAIVIGFGVTAFLIVLASRGYEETRDVNLGEAVGQEGEE